MEHHSNKGSPSPLRSRDGGSRLDLGGGGATSSKIVSQPQRVLTKVMDGLSYLFARLLDLLVNFIIGDGAIDDNFLVGERDLVRGDT